MYNDKGFIWVRHSEAKSNTMRENWREETGTLISQIGERNFFEELLSEL